MIKHPCHETSPAQSGDHNTCPFELPIKICDLFEDTEIAETSDPDGLLIRKDFLLSSSSDKRTEPSLNPTKTAFSPGKLLHLLQKLQEKVCHLPM